MRTIAKPAPPCTAQGHEISRSFGLAKDGVVIAECICWTCTDRLTPESDQRVKAWTERWRLAG